MLKKFISVLILLFCTSFLLEAQTNYKWRIGGEWVGKNLRPPSIYGTAGVGLLVERQFRTDSTFKYSVALGFVHLYGYSPRLLNDAFYETNFGIAYIKGSYMFAKKLDLNFSAGGTNMGLFIAPGIGESWKRFQFNLSYRFAILPFKKGQETLFKNHFGAGILYNFIRH